MNDREKFGERVKFYRKKLGMTQGDLAERTSYSRGAISNIEIGRTDIPKDKIEELASVLQVTPGELMGWEEKGMTDQQKRILAYFRYLNPEGMDKIEERLEELINMPKYRENFKIDN